MLSTKEKIIKYFNRVLAMGIRETLLVIDAPEKHKIHNVARFIVIIDGSVEISFFRDMKIETAVYGPGTGLYCGENGYLYSAYKTPTKSISLSFYGSFIRNMYIDFDGIHKAPTSRDTYYHTNKPLSRSGQKLLNTLDETAKNQHIPGVASRLLEALLLISIEEIKSVGKERNRPSLFLWDEINNYLRNHCEEPLTREAVAAKFKISPGYLSRIFKIFHNKTFNTVFTMYRLEYATILLRQTRLSVDEIALRSGYRYTAYFIRRFKVFYGVTPHVFRYSSKKTVSILKNNHVM